jgi:alcohol dehydrogenase (NADP+)
MTFKVKAYAAQSADKPLAPFSFDRRDPGSHDIQIDILYCGVCHSDLHQARDDWSNALYPMVPGHEIVGRVVRVGEHVKKVKAGDFAAVGVIIDSCRRCEPCNGDLEQYCAEGCTTTYNGRERGSEQLTFGGYSEQIVVEERFVHKVPENLDIKAVAPLLCAGITTYSPLRYWEVGKGQTVGVIGLGGLGHLGVKFAKAMGAHVVMITTSPKKGEDALRLGADEVLVSTDPAAMAKAKGSFNLLLDTIPVGHDLNPYLNLLKLDGAMAIVGALTALEPVMGVNLMLGRRTVGGSIIGGMAETQEMLDFCGQHGIVSDIEMIDMADINAAYERMQKNDVRYRFVIDMASLKAA